MLFSFEHILTSKSSREILYSNLFIVIRNVPKIANDQTFTLVSLQRILQVLNNHDSKLGDEFLAQISKASLKISFDQVFHGYVSFINFSYSTNPAATFYFSLAMSDSISSEENKAANEILHKSLTLFSKDSVDAKALNAIQKLFKNNSGNASVQKVAVTLAKIMKRFSNYEASPECFSAYHTLVYELLHILAKIKNEANVYTCCSDVKRHEIFLLISSVFPLVLKIISTGKFTNQQAKSLNFHVTYILQVCNEMKCEWKKKARFQAFCKIYNTLYEIHGHKEKIVAEMAFEVDKAIKSLFNAWNFLTDEDKKEAQNPGE